MKVRFEECAESESGQILVIEIPVSSEPKVSASGKSILIASTGGNVKTSLKHLNEYLTVSVNAYVPKR